MVAPVMPILAKIRDPFRQHLRVPTAVRFATDTAVLFNWRTQMNGPRFSA